MKTIPPQCPEPEVGPKYWRSLDQMAETPEFRAWAEKEFPAGASEMTDPVTNIKSNCTMVWRDVSENEKRFEMTCKQPAQESRMEAVYTRGSVGMR